MVNLCAVIAAHQPELGQQMHTSLQTNTIALVCIANRCMLTYFWDYAGYIPAGMSRDEAQSRGFLGGAGGGLLGLWLGHKFGKKQGHGFLGSLGGAGAGAFIGNKLF